MIQFNRWLQKVTKSKTVFSADACQRGINTCDKMEQVSELFERVSDGIPYTCRCEVGSQISAELISDLIVYYDYSIEKEKIVAYIDTSLLKSTSLGLVFCENGFYHKDTVVAQYFPYDEIESVTTDGCQVLISMRNSQRSHALFEGIDENVLVEIINGLRRIWAKGEIDAK